MKLGKNVTKLTAHLYLPPQEGNNKTIEDQWKMVDEHLGASNTEAPELDRSECTPLTFAVVLGNVPLCQKLLDVGAEVDGSDNKGSTALHIASATGNIDACVALLSQGAALEKTNDDSRTPLLCAARLGHTAVVEFLLDQGADINSTDNNGATALHWASYNGHTEACAALLSRGAALEKTTNDDIFTPLLEAAQNGHTATVKFLLDQGAKPDAVDEDGWTALHWASKGGCVEICIALLSQRASLEAKSKRGSTPLLCAAQHGQTATVEFLLGKGANKDATRNNGATALHWASYNGHTEACAALLSRGAALEKTTNDDIFTPLLEAAQNGHTATVKFLLDRGAKPDAVDEDGWTALHWTSGKGHLALVELLLKRDANPNVPNQNHYTALDLAILNGHEQVAKLLKEKGGTFAAIWFDISSEKDPSEVKTLIERLISLGEDINTLHEGAIELLKKNPEVGSEKRINTPLLIAAWKKNIPMMQCLLLHGANAQLVSPEGYTPLLLCSIPKGFAAASQDPELQELVRHDGKLTENVLKIKLLGHRLSLLGDMYRSLHPCITYPAMADSIELYAQKTPSKRPFFLAAATALKEAVDPSLLPVDLADNSARGKVISLNAGWFMHATSLVVYGHWLAKGNRGPNKTGKTGITIYRIGDPKNLAQALEKLHDFNVNRLDDASAKIQARTDEAIDFFEKGIDKLLNLEEVDLVEMKGQKNGNCGWIATKLALRAMLIFQSYSELGNMKDAVLKANEIYKPFVRFDRLTAIGAIEDIKQDPLLQKFTNNNLYHGIASKLAKKGESGVVKNILKKNPQLVKELPTSIGYPLLHMAVSVGDLELATFFLGFGSELEQKTIEGFTPLIVAALEGKEEAVRFLLQAGASINATDNNGWTALHWASATGHTGSVVGDREIKPH